MGTKTKTVLVPQYIRQFSCIGSACEDSCCVGWRVNIDEQTYKKYKRSDDFELAPIIEKNVTRNRSNPSSANFAKIKMNPNNACSFLNEEKLCKIQLNLGEDYLSTICASYPRIFNEVNGVKEKSATVSCPEIARLTLLNPDGIEFDEIEEVVDERFIINKKLDTHDKKLSSKVEKYFWELRIFTIQLLQNREYSLSDRLIILGMFYQKADEYIANKQVDQIPHLIGSYLSIIEEGSLKESLGSVPVQPIVQLELVKEMTEVRFFQGISNERYLECLSNMLNGLHYITGTPFEEVVKQYPVAYECYKPFMEENEYILENYLVNYVYKNMFPLSGTSHLFDDYVMLVVHYSMIKLHLIGMAGFHQGLNTELVIKLIQSFAKTVEHNSLFLKKLFDLLKENGYNTMPYMSILVKN